MSDDPAARSTISALKDLAARHREVATVLAAAARELESRSVAEPERGSQGVPGGALAEAAAPDSPVIRAFSARLAEVYGVRKVTVASADPNGYRFLVEMDPGGEA